MIEEYAEDRERSPWIHCGDSQKKVFKARKCKNNDLTLSNNDWRVN